MKLSQILRPSLYFIPGKITVITLLVLLLASCSTKKNTMTRRLYHNLTAHYNAYWNGRQSIREGEAELHRTVKDNYTFILPVFNYGTKEQAVAINPQMDRAIEKGSKVIQKHSMFFNNKEYVQWIDDSYLMIGMAYFYKQEYLMARRTFDYVIKNYEHDPIKYEAMIWLSSTYIQQEEWNKAQSLLDLVQSEIDKEVVSLQKMKRLPLVYADFYIRQGLYKQAIPYLERSLEINHEKLIQCRLLYIMGQIYQADKDYEASSEYYTSVIRRGAPYEMAFNARINLAQSYSTTTGDKKMIIKELQKMIKDLKNEDFLDQIYYALAEIALKEKDDSLGINYLRLSVSKSTSNLYQKSVSSLRLADLFFSYPDYPNAQLYYDTAVMFLPEDYPNYDPIVTKARLLTELVTHLTTVHVQDSLQAIALMPDPERNALISKLIADYQEKERLRKEQEAEMDRQRMMASSNYQTQQNVDRLAGGKWYFYNPSTLSFGYNEFIKRWGNRKLEDLWRLKNKQMTSTFGQEEELAASDSDKTDSTTMASTDLSKPETYLQNLPLTPEQMAKSHEMVASALYQSAIIYDDGLADFPAAIRSYNSLIERYPDDKRVLESYYNMYSIYNEQQDAERAAFYRDLIVNNYPESDFAKIIMDPNYNLVLQAQRNKAAVLYEETYQAFVNEQYMMVKIYSEEAIVNYAEDKVLIPKFEYLRVLAMSQTISHDSLGVLLARFIETYPSSEVTPLAQNVLNHLTMVEATLAAGDSLLADSTRIEQAVIAPYQYDPESTHFYILIVEASTINVNATKVRISDHNMKYHRLDNLTISSVLLDSKRQMITVSNFRNKEQALTYYTGISNNDYVFSGIPADAFSQFVISSDNYRIFYENKDSKDYLRFFTKNYLAEK
ncbi:MAG: tetratricopeptide repeat protein [Bacteroidales bacterium]|nr:tetratricopeptide repeat protein [Bacteroidales bacterium]